MPEVLRGLGVSPGRTAGPVHAMATPPGPPADEPLVTTAGEQR